jgi:signal peptidase
VIMPTTVWRSRENLYTFSAFRHFEQGQESDSREIWSYCLDGNGLVAPRLVKKFPDFDIDGIRTDVDGRLYVAPMLKGTIALLTDDGRMLREIRLNVPEPSNLAFGGGDGRTVFVTQRKGGYIESFLVPRLGREFCMQDNRCSTPVIRRPLP